MKVEATKLGFYGVQRWREGQVFEIENEKEFSFKWMKPIGWEPSKKAPKGYELKNDVIVVDGEPIGTSKTKEKLKLKSKQNEEVI